MYTFICVHVLFQPSFTYHYILYFRPYYLKLNCHIQIIKHCITPSFILTYSSSQRSKNDSYSLLYIQHQIHQPLLTGSLIMVLNIINIKATFYLSIISYNSDQSILLAQWPITAPKRSALHILSQGHCKDSAAS